MELITCEQLKARLADKENLNLLDVREPAEHEAYNVGGISIPLGNIMSMQIDEIENLKDQEVICYCRSGNRSMQASLMLETMGFQNVKNLAGGMVAWAAMQGDTL